MATVEAFRMDLREYRIVFIAVTFVVALLVASPALQRLLVWPRTEFFTELWLLGPNQNAEDYPFNITRGQNYTVYMGIGNQLGYCGFYQVEVKLRNDSQPAPTSFGPQNTTPSSLSSLFNMTAFVADQTVWEKAVTFGFDYGFNETLLRVEFYSLTLNNIVLDLNGLSAVWNGTTSRFYGNLIFELWLYAGSAGNLEYHRRFVDLKLNMTVV